MSRVLLQSDAGTKDIISILTNICAGLNSSPKQHTTNKQANKHKYKSNQATAFDKNQKDGTKMKNTQKQK